MTKQEFIQWICEKLSAILQFEVQNDMAEYEHCCFSGGIVSVRNFFFLQVYTFHSIRTRPG